MTENTSERPCEKNEKLILIEKNIERVIIGKNDVIKLVLTAMLAEGHILIEDVPGVGKTQLVSALAGSVGGVFGRIQLTPDIMPSDITGFSMINPSTHDMEFRKGAAFCNFLLADEINRASPKTQSALLEIMEETQVSIDGMTHRLPRPFMVLATQNPVETYGTYHLPEAQMDRFIMKISMGYPARQDELSILKHDENALDLWPVISCPDISELISTVKNVVCTDKINEYIIDISRATRNSEYIRLGVSPRGSIAMQKTAKAYAFISGRNYVIPDDIKLLSPFVLAHRIQLNPRGKSSWETPENAIKNIIDSVAVPI